MKTYSPYKPHAINRTATPVITVYPDPVTMKKFDALCRKQNISMRGMLEKLIDQAVEEADVRSTHLLSPAADADKGEQAKGSQTQMGGEKSDLPINPDAVSEMQP